MWETIHPFSFGKQRVYYDGGENMAYCDWAGCNEKMQRYHDEEWGIPLHDDIKQFEFLMMEAMQCGLNWNMMIQKREIFHECFADFDFDKIAAFDEKDVQRIMETPGMIRSPMKIRAVIHNARCFQKLREEWGSFSSYIWHWSDGKTILYDHHAEGMIPASNGLSVKISRDLKKRGFKYLGPVTIYSHLQACGIINDHDKNCKRYNYINENFPTVRKKRLLEKDARQF